MIIYESWLRVWINTDLTLYQLADRLTLSGLEVERIWKLDDRDDMAIEIAITPNRGDCLSVFGIARELSVLLGIPIRAPQFKTFDALTDRVSVSIQDTAYCHSYCGAVLHAIDVTQPTPDFISDVLIANGIDLINIAVDVTNYVMLMHGQPMHAFDLHSIDGAISVRRAHSGDRIALLNGVEKELSVSHVVIADESSSLAIPGIMGGESSKVTTETRSIFLESASFHPEKTACLRQELNLHSDSAYRFERGVDPMLHQRIIHYAIELLMTYAHAELEGLVYSNPIECVSRTVSLFLPNVKRYLGLDLSFHHIESLLGRVGVIRETHSDRLILEVPSHRFDLNIEADLIEEIARLSGYDSISSVAPTWPALSAPLNPSLHAVHQCKCVLAAMGYRETVTYSFVSRDNAVRFSPRQSEFIELANPISSDMSVMRGSLLAGLIQTLAYNQARQQHDVRLFEIARVFLPAPERDVTDVHAAQPYRLAGLIAGRRQSEQWAYVSENLDFFDLKGDLEYLFQAFQCDVNDLTWRILAESDPLLSLLHPFQHAEIWYQDRPIGYIGQLHPVLAQDKNITNRVFVFEFDISVFFEKRFVRFHVPSLFPEIQRDLSLIVPIDVNYDNVKAKVDQLHVFCLTSFYLFDVYQGKGVPEGFRSLALRFVFQSMDRTLTDADVTDWMDKIVSGLETEFNAKLRSLS